MTAARNLSASVHQRLLNRARCDGRPFNELLQYYAMERFLYRLVRSAHSDRFVLKGALMLEVWCSQDVRSTMDIDLLGLTSNAESDLTDQVRDILGVDVEPDGLVFDPGTIQTDRITEDTEYEGIRIRFEGTLGTAKVHMQLDIGFGDNVYPEPAMADFPTMLDFPAPRLLCYSRESSIAEKFEAMTKLGMLNSRMKDFFDIWLLSRRFDFDGPELARAIQLTFEKRGTPLPQEIVAFSSPFIKVKEKQWAAFRNRLPQDDVPVSFKEVVASVELFISPVVATLTTGNHSATRWTASGPWT